MLESKSEFPFAGSTAFLKPEGRELRVIQHQCDGRLLVQRVGPEWDRSQRATGTMTVERTDVTATRDEAIIVTKRGRKAA
ncbi:hypothetical protein [Croceicoccus sp. BE223]|uniref:hypothetical protein n=1 Tax=Croceicoccus sp. BE223 TaxID=2817716 RepID=UPI0028549252|nr:hypothetical protein [Croceicoccus sp. BE223]MDR7101490.1 hypothetical protein [Croceicoccus sp. BE223]